jgi:hypothetical protein
MNMRAADYMLAERFRQLTPLVCSSADEAGALNRQADSRVLFDHEHVSARFCGVFCGH